VLRLHSNEVRIYFCTSPISDDKFVNMVNAIYVSFQTYGIGGFSRTRVAHTIGFLNPSATMYLTLHDVVHKA